MSGGSWVLRAAQPAAPFQAARQALLAGYFEPTDEDRAEERKVPTVAHHAIAHLVACGAPRVPRLRISITH
jgi:hypothetical protein